MRPWSIVLSISTVPLIALALTAPPAGRRTKKPSAAEALPAPIATFVAGNCVSCHNATARSGNLDLGTLKAVDTLRTRRETWESVLRKVTAGEMPPSTSPRPDGAAERAFERALGDAIERVDSRSTGGPGRVTARRLNRTEYNNTIRDLLGVDTRPADDFPQDDSGYGFDNNGDVLSLSPSQMDRYVATAEIVARTAIFGLPRMQPTLVRHEVSGRRIVPLYTVPASYDTSGLTLSNSLHATHRFPADAEYLFRIKLDGLRPLGSAALHFAVLEDGKRIKSIDFDPTGDAAFNLDRQDFSARTIEFRTRVSSGEHWIAVAIERMYEGLPPQYSGPNPSKKPQRSAEFRPPPGLSPERIAQIKQRIEARAKERVQLNDARVSALDVGGPYDQAVGPSTESVSHVFTCGHLHGGHKPECTAKILGSMICRAFRHPATKHDIDRYVRLYNLARSSGDSFDEGICVALQGILVSPNFLYRIERDPLPLPAGGAHPISENELAARLSYFLWSTMPDDALRSAADRGALRMPGALDAQVRRMLKDPRSIELARNFASQWLQFRALESVHPDRERFPGFDEYLRISMRRETELFFDSVVREDQSVLDLLNGKYSYLNGKLAAFYGIPGVDGPEFRRVDLAGTPRAGIITQASVLTASSYPNRTSPVLRGKWILENILNAPPPAPPPGVPNLDVTTVGTEASLRQQLEAHRKNPTCAACHAKMDPLGFGLENFDAIGQWRTNDGKIAIDSSGTLPDGRTFRGPDGLRAVLDGDKDAFVRCLTAKLLTYALGRGLLPSDSATVNTIAKRVAASGYRFSSLVLEVAASEPFQMRSGDPAK